MKTGCSVEHMGSLGLNFGATWPSLLSTIQCHPVKPTTKVVHCKQVHVPCSCVVSKILYVILVYILLWLKIAGLRHYEPIR